MIAPIVQGQCKKIHKFACILWNFGCTGAGFRLEIGYRPAGRKWKGGRGDFMKGAQHKVEADADLDRENQLEGTIHFTRV